MPLPACLVTSEVPALMLALHDTSLVMLLMPSTSSSFKVSNPEVGKPTIIVSSQSVYYGMSMPRKT